MKNSLFSVCCAIVFATLPFLPRSGSANETQCPQPEKFEIRVIPVHGDVKYDLTKSFLEIQRSAGPTITAKHYPLLGMAVQGFGIGFLVETGAMPRGDSLFCPVLSGVEIRIGWADRTVFVAREVTTVNCLYSEALEHQLRHVRLEDEALDAFVPVFTQELRKSLAELRAQPQRDATFAKKQLTDSVGALLNSLTAPLEKERGWRLDIVESPDELNRIRTACGDIEKRLREMGKAL